MKPIDHTEVAAKLGVAVRSGARASPRSLGRT